MLKTIHYSKQALQDLDDIFDYISINKQNFIAAKNTIQGIKSSISELKSLDNLGMQLILPGGIETPYRFIRYKNYLAFYRAEKSDVYIDRIIYGKRDYARILFD